MARYDDIDDEDERPRPKRRPRDDDDDGPPRGKRSSRSNDDDDDFDSAPKGKAKNRTPLILGIVGVVVLLCCVGPGIVGYVLYKRTEKAVKEIGQEITKAADTRQSEENLRSIGRAIHSYSDINGTLPNNSYDTQVAVGKRPTGQPLLSWRVHILPQMGQQQLYARFKLDEPWNSPNNLPLVNSMPDVFATPEAKKLAGNGKTFYRGFSHQGAIFERPMVNGAPPTKIPIHAIPDGLMNTLSVVESGEAIEWTKPDDIDWSIGRPRPSLGGGRTDKSFFLVLMMDGQPRKLSTSVDDTTLRNLIHRQDGNVVNPIWLP